MRENFLLSHKNDADDNLKHVERAFNFSWNIFFGYHGIESQVIITSITPKNGHRFVQ